MAWAPPRREATDRPQRIALLALYRMKLRHAITVVLVSFSGAVRVHVAVEGGIGIGKTTLLQDLQAHLKDPSIAFRTEPVDVWREHGLLDGMYNKSLSSAVFQLTALTTRFGGLLTALADPEVAIVVTERSMRSDYQVFAESNLEDQVELAAYRVAYEHLRQAIPEDVVEATVYLAAPNTDIVRNRIRNRGRPEEQNIPETYLEALSDAHERMFQAITHHKLRVDASQPPEVVAQEVIAFVKSLSAESS